MTIAEPIHEVAERHIERVGDAVPGVEGAVRCAMFKIDQHGSGEACAFREGVIGQAAFGT